MSVFYERTVKFLTCAALGISLLMITGCGGCNNSEKDKAAKKDKDKKEKEKPKPKFEDKDAVFLPGQSDDVVRSNRAKVGHWVSSQYNCVSNRSDFDGRLASHPISMSTEPKGIPGTEFYLESTRPVSLPKEQWKNLETTLFIPNRQESALNATFEIRLEDRNGITQNEARTASVLCLKEYQNHFVVLSKRPAAFSYLKILDCIKLPDFEGNSTPENFYHLVYSLPDEQVPLPSRSLTWTTIAYILWDNLDPSTLNPEQRTALVDWLHWGGQLIVSGPDSLEKLEDSFLGEYLPAVVDKSVNLTRADFETLNSNWSVARRQLPDEKHAMASEDFSVLGAKFSVAEGGRLVASTGGLVVEKRVGRGRIVATGFTLNSKTLLTWKSFPGFFHSCLMRRPTRKFIPIEIGSTQMNPTFAWESEISSIYDPLLTTNLRYVSRDLGIAGTTPSFSQKVDEDFGNSSPMGLQRYYQPEEMEYSSIRNLKDQERFGGFDSQSYSGVGGWNDFSAVSDSARETLMDAAGITPPSRNFVLRMLMMYLAVLVPLNWVIFRLIGRVEWAWVMAPVISVLGAVAVAKYASLDIGFVRSSTTVGVLEMHSDYPRGHLTNYTALYTSLSTNYDVRISDGSALVLPFAKKSPRKTPDGLNRVDLAIGRDITFKNFPIQSNTTELYHSENMVDVGGVIRLVDRDGETILSNGTEMDIHDAAVVRRTENGKLQFAWIGEMRSASESKSLEWMDCAETELTEFWNDAPVMYSPTRQANLIIQQLIESKLAGRTAEGGELDSGEEDAIRASREFDFQEILEIIKNRPDSKDRWERYQSAARRSPAVPVEQRSKFPNMLITESQLAEICDSANDDNRFRLGVMLDALATKLEVGVGQSRMIGWFDDDIGQATIDPKATQTQNKSVLLVHLNYKKLVDPPVEKGVYSDYAKIDFDEDEDEEDGVQDVP